MKPLVIYHKNCADGFGAAFAAWKLLGDYAEYLPLQYEDIRSLDDIDLLGEIAGRKVHILDFSLPLEVMDRIFRTAKHTTWLDHHKTAFEMFWRDPKETWHKSDPSQFILLHNESCGAALAWNHYVDPTETPLMVKYLDDYDRWIFNYEHTKPFNKALWALAPWTFQQWEEILTFTSEEMHRFIAGGEVLLKDHHARVAKHVEHWRSCTIDGKTGLAVNAPVYVASDVAHELACISGTFGMTYVIGADLEVICSLRSLKDFDVSALAKTLGGGGHKTASGFRTDIPTLLTFLKDIPTVNVWGRTCQECGHVQESKPPTEYTQDEWIGVCCKKCKSEALDYGSESFVKDSSWTVTRVKSS